MKLRTKWAATVFLGASLLFGGVADAAPTEPQAGGITFEWLCEFSGGVYLGGTEVSYCFYRDGTIVACYKFNNKCVTYPPEKNALTSASTASTPMVVR